MGAGEAAPSVIGLVRARVGQAWGGVLCPEGGGDSSSARARLPAAERAPERRAVARTASLAGSSRGGAGQPEGKSDWQLGRGRAEPSPGSCCYGERAVRADGTRKGRGSAAVGWGEPRARAPEGRIWKRRLPRLAAAVRAPPRPCARWFRPTAAVADWPLPGRGGAAAYVRPPRISPAFPPCRLWSVRGPRPRDGAARSPPAP